MGFDEGCVMIKIGREEPVASMDASGKVIWARHNDIQTVNIKSLGAEQEVCPQLRSLADLCCSCHASQQAKACCTSCRLTAFPQRSAESGCAVLCLELRLY